MNTQVQWLTPSPLWRELSTESDPVPFRRPAILRFTSDAFIPEFLGVLRQTPQALRNYVAQGETWRAPLAGLDLSPSGLPLKLYQPTQARFYLVASSLTCRVPGLPDHTINRTQGEDAVFVVRQLRPNAGFSPADCAVYDPVKCSEYAWIPGDQPGWSKVIGPDLVAGEEQIPLSPARTINGSGNGEPTRQVLNGLIPTSRRQQYVAARTLSNGNGNGNGNSGTAMDPRADLFNRQVIQPWANLQSWWNDLGSNQGNSEYIGSAQYSSALILLDFATFLLTNIPRVWAAILDSSRISAQSGVESALYNAISVGLQQALVNAKKFETALDGAATDTWPPYAYPPYSLADAAVAIAPTTLLPLVTAALPAPAATFNLQPVPQKPANPQGDYFFVVRCAYVRPKCLNNVLSPPSQPFQMASFFDSDAPARRIQVALPVDTSPAALRSYDKGIAFLISSELSNQMSRVKSLKDMSDGTIGAEGTLDIGTICSFSIPIITICALMLLLVIVTALNLVFFWIPFFKICFPVPGLKGK